MRGPRTGRLVETGSVAGSLSIVLAATGLLLSPTIVNGLGFSVEPGAANILYAAHMAGAVLLVGFVAWHLIPPTYAFIRKPGQSWTSYATSMALLTLVLVEVWTGWELYAHAYFPLDKATAVAVHLTATFLLVAVLVPHALRGIRIGLDWRRSRQAAVAGATTAGRPEVAAARERRLSRRAFVRITSYAALGVAFAYAIGVGAWREINGWRLNSVGKIPDLTKETWRLKVTGLVNRPIELTFDDLRRMNDVTWDITHHCVEGWTYRNTFTGVRLSDILARAGGVAPGAAMLVFKSPEVSRQYFAAGETYTTNFPYTDAAAREALVAYAVAGRDIPPEHGFPVRLMTPEKWGYKACKWLTEIEVTTDAAYHGYWEKRGYHNTGDLDGPIFA